MSSVVEKLKRERGEALAKSQSKIDAAQRRRRLLCHHCGRRSTVGKTTYVQTHFYVSPYSCTEGDYWKQGEGRFVCLHCGWENRFWKPGKYGGDDNRGWITDLKYYFAKVEDVYEDGCDQERTDGRGKDLPKREWCN